MAGFGNFNKASDVARVNNTIPMTAGNLGIELRNHLFGMLYGRKGYIYRYPEGTIAVFVRRGNLNHGNVKGKHFLPE